MTDNHDHEHQRSNCNEALEELYLFLDGELTEERRYTIKSHLEDCSRCFEAFDFEAELRIVIAHRCRDEVPESFKDKIAALIEEDAAAHDTSDSSQGG